MIREFSNPTMQTAFSRGLESLIELADRANARHPMRRMRDKRKKAPQRMLVENRKPASNLFASLDY